MSPPTALLPGPLRSALSAVPLLRNGDGLERAVRDRRVVVTGASSGIGRSLARAVGDADATVLVIARRGKRLAALVREIEQGGGNAYAYPADLSSAEEVERVSGEILAEHGGVDVLVNNAGHSIRRSVAASQNRVHDFERTMALNYFGALRLTLAFLPGMRERGCGHVVNVSTMGVLVNTPFFSAYLASKAALDAFARSMAPEVIRDGVHVTTVHMPLARTPMSAPTPIYDRMPALSADQAAAMVCEAIVSRQREVTPFPGRLSRLLYPLASKTADRVMGTAVGLIPEQRARRER